MRRELGLDPPERRIGLSAHDFAQALGAPRGHPFARGESRRRADRFFALRAALCGAGRQARWNDAVARGDDYLAFARTLDAPAEVVPAARPEPSPPLDVRPQQLSVTDIENWLRDPYTIYAKHVLRLAPLEAVDTPPGAADRGSAIHEAIGAFTQGFAAALPADPEKELIAFGRRASRRSMTFPRRAPSGGRASCASRAGSRVSSASGAPRWRRCTGKSAASCRSLSARGRSPSPAAPTASSACKTAAMRSSTTRPGRPPTSPQVRSGLAPQLTLEAAILRGGGFKEFPSGSVAELCYVYLKGGEPAGKPELVDFKQSGPDDYADYALQRLTEIARKFLIDGERLPLAGAPDVAEALRRLRPSGAREGMGRLGRRKRSRLGTADMSANVERQIPEGVRRRQVAAADPGRSVFVSANAGSGKTHVLAQRVINLLLRGEDPAKMLCITFTKAAAANMAKRVFDTLAAWTALDDQELDARIRASGGNTSGPAQRARARRLFATALETPGGLKVQTIHAFCTRLLHQFPFEADVAASFDVLDEAATTQMLNDLTLQVMLEAAVSPDGALGRALATAITSAADVTFKEVIAEAIGKRDIVENWVAPRRRS